MMYLDTNVIVYAIENHPKYGKASVAILNDIQKGVLIAGASVLVLAELINVLKKLNTVLLKENKKPLSIEKNIEAVLSLPVEWFELDLFTIKQASSYSYQISGADYTHIASMEVHSVREIISADKELDKVPFIHRLDPLDYSSIN